MNTETLKVDDRAEFEAWMSLNFDTRLLRSGIGYKGRVVNSLWMAWQASRAALVVELPEYQEISCSGIDIPDEFDWPDGFNTAIKQCSETLRAAGITIKGDGDGN